jgi:hypothetical protein
MTTVNIHLPPQTTVSGITSSTASNRSDREASPRLKALQEAVPELAVPLYVLGGRTIHHIIDDYLQTPSAFPRLRALDACLHVLSFLHYRGLIHFCSTTKSAQQLRDKTAKIERAHFARIPIFGRAQYKYYWGVEITDEFDPDKIDIRRMRLFLKTYHGPNPVDPTKRVEDTCLMPTVVPERVMVVGRVFEFNLDLLGQLAEYPGGNGHKAKYAYDSEALQQHGTVKAERPSLCLQLRGVIGRNRPWSRESENPDERGQVQILRDLNARTGYGCEEGPDASQIAVALAHHAATDERPLGDASGMEGRYTYGRTREIIRYRQSGYHMVSGGFSAGAIGPLGGSAPAELDVSSLNFDCGNYGVGVLRKF